ncbi:MAG: signal peptidase II [Mollicutes bacterium]|nr:signal peptidase II [Mollicutes bacterium]
MIKKLLITMCSCIFIDQLIKIIVRIFVDLNDSYVIINNFFYLTRVHNLGAAWGILAGNRYFLIFVALIFIIIFYFIFIKDKKITNFEAISYGILLGGIIGNLIDRLIYGYVIDYLDFYPFGYNYPVFNFADMCIVISIVLVVIKMIKDDHNGKVYNK